MDEIKNTNESNLKVISIGTDRTLFDKNSQARARIAEYGLLVGEMHIVVFTLKNLGLVVEKIAENVWIYPTNSRTRFGYMKDAKKLGREIIVDKKFVRGQSLITSQDPFETGRVGLFLKKKFRLPLQTQIHTDFGSPYFKKVSFLNRLRVFMSGKIIRNSDSFRVVSNKIKNTLVDKYHTDSSKISVLPIFVSIKENTTSQIERTVLRKKYPQFNTVILTVSRLAKEKNISFTIKVFFEVFKTYKDIGLIIVGDGVLKRDLENQVKRLGLSDNVIFLGWQNDISEYYKMADIFINTSYFEGFGMTLLEAGSFGCPVLTTDVGIASDLYIGAEQSFVCPIGGKKIFVEKMISLISSPILREITSAILKENSKKFFISKEEYLRKYKEILEKHYVR